MKKLELTQENFAKYAPLYTRVELTTLFDASLSLIDRAKKSWGIPTKQGSIGRPKKFKE